MNFFMYVLFLKCHQLYMLLPTGGYAELLGNVPQYLLPIIFTLLLRSVLGLTNFITVTLREAPTTLP